MSTLTWRPDIDGLRAVAVGAVVGYHAGVPLLAGGYLGVDVFFVISGFLITALIRAEMAVGSFSPTAFLARRIRRLLPAQIVVFLVATVLAAWLLLPPDFMGFGAEMLASLFSVGNWYFLSAQGYFEPAGEERFLLHMWSLGVEEQVYLLLVAVLMALRAAPRQIVALALGGLALASFHHAVGLVGAGQGDAAFYGTQARLWEFLVGALLALAPRPNPVASARPMLQLAGLAVVAGSLIVGPVGPFPGIGAGPVVLGTVLILAGGGGPVRGAGRILSNAAMVRLGRLSYGLYLWHWVILVALRHAVPAPEAVHVAAAVAVSVLLAALSHRLVETPMRRGAVLATPRRALGFLVASLGVLALVPVLIQTTAGGPGRYPSALRAQIEASGHPDHAPFCTANAAAPDLTECRIGLAGRAPDLAILGDSHALMLVPALDALARGAGRAIVVTAVSGCPPLPDLPLAGPPARRVACDALQARLVDTIRRPDGPLVALVSRWSYYMMSPWGAYRAFVVDARTGQTMVAMADAQAVFARQLGVLDGLAAETGRTVHVMRQLPEMRWDVPVVLRHLWLPAVRGLDATDLARVSAAFGIAAGEREREFGDVARALDRLTHVHTPDPGAVFCQTGVCGLFSGGRLLYSDTSHLGATGSAMIATGLLRAIWPSEPPVGEERR